MQVQQQQDMQLQPTSQLDASYMQNGQSNVNTSQYPNSNQISSVDQSASNMMMVRSLETRRILNMSGAYKEKNFFKD